MDVPDRLHSALTLTCEWNQHSDDGQHAGRERCTDCLVAGKRPGYAEDCTDPYDRPEEHCPTCTCSDDGPSHSEGFVSCDEHLDKVMAKNGLT